MKIGIFGGSFNPPHKMHKNIALKLLDNNILDRVIFVPTGEKYNKDTLIESSHRYNMLKLMCRDDNRLDVSDFELKNMLVSSYQSLDHFRGIYKQDEIFFILGTDNLYSFYTWKNYEYMLQNYKFIVIRRKGFIAEEIIKKYQKYRKNILITDISMNDISSTYIRNLISSKLDIIDDYVDDVVYKYIIQNKLYV